MADIARWGHGKYYPADNVSKIPQIFLKVARTVAHSGLIEGSFFPQEDAPSPILAGINAVPALGGYAITSPKPLATIVLASSKSDPILAQWQYGAGRAVAWTSDSQGRWTANWLANRQTSRIWASMVNWVLPAPQSSGLSLTTSQAAGSATIGVDLQNSTPYSAITARVVGPQGASTVTLQPTTPTHFEAQLPTGATGAYLVRVAAKEAGPHAPIRNISGGLVVPYPPDFRDSGLDIAALQEIAAAGGGSVLSRTADAFAENLQSVDTPTSLQWPLLLLALLLLPFDVAARRLVLTREDWRALAAALRPFRRIVPEQLEPSRQLAAIRARRRSRQPAAPAKQAATFESAPPAVPRQEPSDDAGSVSAGWPAATAVKPTPTGGHGPETASAQQFGQQAEKEAVAESTASKLLDAKRRRGR